MDRKIQSVVVFCGSQGGTEPAYLAAAREVGSYLGEQGIRLVYGGGSVGMMGAVADSCLEADGEVVGVIPSFLMDKELGHTGVQTLEVVDSMLERKTRMAELADASVTLPGGIGTMDELFEMLTWRRLSIHEQPVGLLNVGGYYDELISFVHSTMVEAGYINPEGAGLLMVSDDFENLISEMEMSIPKP